MRHPCVICINLFISKKTNMMKRNKSLSRWLFAGICSLFLTTGCSVAIKGENSSKDILPSQHLCEKKFGVEKFHAVSVNRGIHANYRQTSGKSGVTIHVPENLEQYLVVKVKNDGTLNITFNFPKEDMGIRGDCRTTIDIEGGALTHIRTSSAGKFTATSNLETPHSLTLYGSSAGSIDLKNVKCDALQADLSSAANLRMQTADCTSIDCTASSASGLDIATLNSQGTGSLSSSSAAKINLAGKTAGNLEMQASSGSQITANRLTAKNVTAEASSGASIKCCATGTLTATQRAGGSIGYSGSPKQIVTESKEVSRID